MEGARHPGLFAQQAQRVHGNGGYKKYIGEFELKDITSDFVENKIVDLIKESFAKYGKSTNYNKLSFWK